MSNAIVYVSATGNTKLLADAIASKLSDVVYNGGPDASAADADVIYVGFWAQKFTCPANIEEFLKSLKNKKIFLFGTAGYDNTKESFDNILKNVKENIDSSNEIVGEYMCQGKVSDAKIKGLQEMGTYDNLKDGIAKGVNSPTQAEIDALVALI